MKLFLEQFRELSMVELLAINGGYGSSGGSSSGSYSSAGGSSGASSSYSSKASTASSSVPAHYSATTGWEPGYGPQTTPHSTVPAHYSATTGWEPGWGPNGSTTLAPIQAAIEKDDGTKYEDNCDDWAIQVLKDAGIKVGTTALEGDKVCSTRRSELISQCNNELNSYTSLGTDEWYLGCSSSHMFLVKKSSDGTFTIADSSGFSGWNNGLSGAHSINNYAASPTYGASDAIYVPL